MIPPCAKTATRWSGWAAGDPLDGAAGAGGEVVGRLGVGDDVPALLGDHPHRDRVAVGHLLAEQPALPVAEEDLVEVGVDDRGRCRGRRRAPAPSRAVRRSFET